MRGTIDLDGAYRFPTIADGPQELAATASTDRIGVEVSAVSRERRAIPLSVITQLTFTTAGCPRRRRRARCRRLRLQVRRAAAARHRAASDDVVHGRRTIDDGLHDTGGAGLTAATSKCEIATDAAFGQTAGDPIKTGGGFAEGPARERQYLAALRGPADRASRSSGSGRRWHPTRRSGFVRDYLRGTRRADTGCISTSTIDGPLKAPQALVCAAPVTR
jgi:hypothetical protein